VDRIEAVDKNGAKLNAVIEINPDAIALAKAMDLEMKAGKSRGPLHGIPILIKDNIDTGDKMQTTAGSLALVGNIASNDAFVVENKRQEPY
jgi:amidase